MKKFIFLSALLFMITFKVGAVNVEVKYIDNIYSNRPVNNEVLSGPLGYIYVDGKFAYCLDPSLLIATGEGNYYLDEKYLNNNFTEEEIEYINLVAYFGYEFNKHNHEYYYMAAQELIWEKLYSKDFYWTNLQYPNGKKIDIEKQKKEITHLIENRPFKEEAFEVKINEELVIEDETNTLELYEILENENLEITKEENKLKIVAKTPGEYKIKLQHKNNEKPLLIYSAKNHQTLGSMGSNINLESEFTLKVLDEPKQEEPKKEEPIIEDVLPNTNNPNLPLNVTSFSMICLGLFILRKSY